MKRLTRFAVMAVFCGCGFAFAQQRSSAPVLQRRAPGATTKTQATAVVNPAIWRVKGAHRTVYVFGSLQVMKPNVQWETAKIKAALDASDVVYLEAADIDDNAEQSMVQQLGMDEAHPLSTKISKQDLALLDAAAKRMGMPDEKMFEPMQPWMATNTLVLLLTVKAGYDPTGGIDTTLLAESKGSQKQVMGFETMKDQIHMVADRPQRQQVRKLHRELMEMNKSAGELNKIVTAWEQGDVEAIAKMNRDELAMKYPAEYKRMFVDRNRRFAATLDGLLKDKATGNVFVVVGVGHLAGPNSLLKMLQRDGYKVVRE
jgi:uncharacterized protein YbaP (TraB family)